MQFLRRHKFTLFILSLVCLSLSIAIFFSFFKVFQVHHDRNDKQEKHDWRAYNKTGKTVSNNPASEQQINTLHLKEKKLTIPRAAEWAVRENRVVIGEFKHELWQDPDSQVHMLNHINDDWKEKLGQHLLRFQEENITVLVRPIESYILAAKNQGRYVEEVYVSYLKNGQFLSSYRAMIDSETGEVIKTWSRSVSENIKKRAIKLTVEE